MNKIKMFHHLIRKQKRITKEGHLKQCLASKKKRFLKTKLSETYELHVKLII